MGGLGRCLFAESRAEREELKGGKKVQYNILPIGTEMVAGAWTDSIKTSNRHIQKQVIIPSKLIVFAFQYAKLQTAELRRHHGSAIHSDEALESIFVNKLAELGYALYLGYSTDSILNGKSTVSLQYKAKDERVFIQENYKSASGNPLSINGTKKFCYPIININSRKDHLIVYLDAVFAENKKVSSLKICNGEIKATILGIADIASMNANQNKSVFMGYSNIYTAFTGFKKLRPAMISGAKPLAVIQTIPSFVSSLIKYNKEKMSIELDEAVEFSERALGATATKEIDYEGLFKNIFLSTEQKNVTKQIL